MIGHAEPLISRLTLGINMIHFHEEINLQRLCLNACEESS